MLFYLKIYNNNNEKRNWALLFYCSHRSIPLTKHGEEPVLLTLLIKLPKSRSALGQATQMGFCMAQVGAIELLLPTLPWSYPNMSPAVML